MLNIIIIYVGPPILCPCCTNLRFVIFQIIWAENHLTMGSMKSPITRGVVLFLTGVFFALVLNLLQVQRQVTVFPPEVLASLFSSAWWIPPSCGTAAGMLLRHKYF